jgi:hypothetical protein
MRRVFGGVAHGHPSSSQVRPEMEVPTLRSIGLIAILAAIALAPAAFVSAVPQNKAWTAPRTPDANRTCRVGLLHPDAFERRLSLQERVFDEGSHRI